MLLGKTVGCLSLSQANTVSGICYTINVKCKVEGHKFLELYFNLNSLTDPSMTLIIHHPAGRLSHIRGVFLPFSIKNEAYVSNEPTFGLSWPKMSWVTTSTFTLVMS